MRRKKKNTHTGQINKKSKSKNWSSNNLQKKYKIQENFKLNKIWFI